MNLSFPILSPIPPPDKYHHDYSDLRSPILTQSVLSPIYSIVQSPEFLSDFSRTILPFFQLIPWIMAAILGGGEDALGQLGQFPLEQWFFEMPPCTRYWTTATVITSLLLQCKVITPFQLFYSWRAVYYKSQYWRLITTFIYFGPPSLDLAFHVFFLQRYSRLLEQGSGPSPAVFSWLLLYACASLLALSSLTTSIPFLGSALSSTLVYIWSRRNPDTRLSFLGVLVFTAPYLPWVLMAFHMFMHGSIPKDEILGVVVGHVYYFLADVWPGLHEGQRPMDPPEFWVRLWEGRRAETGDRNIDGDVAAAAARPGEVR
ncbi:hypothetical protein RBB50_010322 [Rhinocladiella similis]